MIFQNQKYAKLVRRAVLRVVREYRVAALRTLEDLESIQKELLQAQNEKQLLDLNWKDQSLREEIQIRFENGHESWEQLIDDGPVTDIRRELSTLNHHIKIMLQGDN